MTVNPSGWRPTAPTNANDCGPETVTGNRALQLEEPLLFERGRLDQTGVDFDQFTPPPRGEVARSAGGVSAAALADLNPLTGCAGAPPEGEHLT